MKTLISLFLILGSIQMSHADEARMRALEARIKALEAQKGSGSSGGLKVRDYGGGTVDRAPAAANNNQPQISPEQMKQYEEAMGKAKSYLEERNKYLEELANEP